jgi:hypothetical protein
MPREMKPNVEIGQNAPKNGCIRFHRRFSKGFSVGTIVTMGAEWQSDSKIKTKPEQCRGNARRRFCGV